MMAFTAAAPIATQPAPLRKVAAISCHGSRATAQPTMPTANKTAPALDTFGRPNRR
jgi:hypothetical protein